MGQRPHGKTAHSILQILHRFKQESSRRCIPHEVGRFSLKLNIYTYTRKLKFWIHLENLPENSIAKQCLQLSSQLAEHKKPSFIFSLNEFFRYMVVLIENEYK